MEDGYILAIAGSTAVTHAQLVSNDGAHVCAGTFNGMHARESQVSEVEAILDSIAEAMAAGARQHRERLRNWCSRIAFAVSGIDHRFDSGILLGRLRDVGFKQINDENLMVAGIAEAAYRGALGSEPGLMIRSGAGCSVFGINKSGGSALRGAWGTVLAGRGSAAALGEEVFHMATAMFDGLGTEKESHIAKAALDKFGVSNGVELLEKLQRLRRVGGDAALLQHLSRTFADSVFEQ